MKKIKSLFKKNVKLVIGIIIGIILAGGGAAVVYALAATSVTYTDTYNIGATTVQDAIDKLYAKANTPAAPTTITAPGGTVFAMVTGRNGYACNSNIIGKLLCVRNGPKNDTNDYNARKAELEKACTAVGSSFSGDSSSARCGAGNFYCRVNSNGDAYCRDDSSNHDCRVDAVDAGYGAVNCR